MALGDLMPINQRHHLHFIFCHFERRQPKSQNTSCSRLPGFEASIIAILPAKWLMAHCRTGSKNSNRASVCCVHHRDAVLHLGLSWRTCIPPQERQKVLRNVRLVAAGCGVEWWKDASPDFPVAGRLDRLFGQRGKYGGIGLARISTSTDRGSLLAYFAPS